MRKVLVAFAFVIVGLALPASAQQPTMAQRQACEQDAYRLCDQFIPNENLVKQCLIKNMSRLNPVCRSAFRPAKGKKR
jgi:hypothetical protein